MSHITKATVGVTVCFILYSAQYLYNTPVHASEHQMTINGQEREYARKIEVSLIKIEARQIEVSLIKIQEHKAEFRLINHGSRPVKFIELELSFLLPDGRKYTESLKVLDGKVLNPKDVLEFKGDNAIQISALPSEWRNKDCNVYSEVTKIRFKQ